MRFICTAALLFVAALLPTAVQGATASTVSIADAFMTAGSSDPNSGNPNGNYGAGGALEVSGAASKEGEIQTLFKFDLSSVKASFDALFGPGNWTVQGIALQLGTNVGTQNQQPGNPIFNKVNTGLFGVSWQASDNWTEGTGKPGAPASPANPPMDGVTWNSLAGLEGTADRTVGTFTYTPIGNTSPGGTPVLPAKYTLTTDASFVADVMAGNAVSLRAYAADATVSYLFNSYTYPSASNPTPANQPTLIVTAIPEPGACSLLAVAAAPLLSGRRRRAQGA